MSKKSVGVGELDVCTMPYCEARLLRNGMHVDKTGETRCLNALFERLTKKPGKLLDLEPDYVKHEYKAHAQALSGDWSR